MKNIIAFCLSLGLLLTACHSDPSKKLSIAATSVPHAEILEFLKPDLAAQGVDLQIIVVEDYNTPNRALADGEIDANFFQHKPFLDMQIRDFAYPLAVLAAVHLEPMGLYSQKINSLSDLKHGAKVAIPSDPSNQARALQLLEKRGLLTLNRHDVYASVLDIFHNPRELSLIEIDSPLLTRSLEDVDLAAITTNFALQGGYSPKEDALALESPDSLFVNIVAVRKESLGREDLQILKQTLQSENTRHYLEEKYQGAILPAFTPQSL